jgi:putative membrane protein
MEAAPAFAHGGWAERAGWSDWNTNPALLLNLILAAWLYGRGIAALWRRAGRGRVVEVWRAMAFGVGMAVLAAALVSPLDALSGQLAWVHMIQHMLLMNAAAPLIVIGAPVFVWTWGLLPPDRQTFGAARRTLSAWRWPWYFLWQPAAVWVLYALTLWIWHAPALYQAALRNPLLHDFQHVTFFLASCLFWRVLLDPLSRFRVGEGVGAIFLFTTSLHAMMLGVFMALAPAAWYPEYEWPARLWGLTALEDQQRAGLIMWMPACMAYAVAAAALFAVWVGRRSDEPAYLDVEGPSS